MSLVQDLNDLCCTLDDKYDINYGGCCYVAYIIAKHLDELNIPYTLVVEEDNIDLDEVNICLKNKIIDHPNSLTGDYTCFHYMIDIPNIGIINAIDKCEDWYYVPVKSYKTIKWIYKNGDWNSYYRTSNNKRVRDSINKVFKKYEREESNSSRYS